MPFATECSNAQVNIPLASIWRGLLIMRIGCNRIWCITKHGALGFTSSSVHFLPQMFSLFPPLLSRLAEVISSVTYYYDSKTEIYLYKFSIKDDIFSLGSLFSNLPGPSTPQQVSWAASCDRQRQARLAACFPAAKTFLSSSEASCHTDNLRWGHSQVLAEAITVLLVCCSCYASSASLLWRRVEAQAVDGSLCWGLRRVSSRVWKKWECPVCPKLFEKLCWHSATEYRWIQSDSWIIAKLGINQVTTAPDAN